MIQIKNLRKSYGDLEVLKGINLDIKAHEITTIVGASGAGKSTLLQIIGTLDHSDSGKVLIDGEELAPGKKEERGGNIFKKGFLYIVIGILATASSFLISSDSNWYFFYGPLLSGIILLLLGIFMASKEGKIGLAKLRNEKIGFVFQFHHLLPEFSAIENIILPGLIAKKSRKQLETRANELLDILNLKNRGDHKPSELSGGEQQRVAIARALINNPMLILADEPSGNLDSKNANELHQLFKRLRDDFNQTFVIVTHNESLANESNRVIELQDGMVINDHYN